MHLLRIYVKPFRVFTHGAVPPEYVRDNREKESEVQEEVRALARDRFAVSNGVEMLRQGMFYVEVVTISTVVAFAIHSVVPEDDK